MTIPRLLSILVFLVYGLPFWVIGIREARDKYANKTVAALEITLGALFTTWLIIIWILREA